MVMIFPELLSDQVGPVNVNAESFGNGKYCVYGNTAGCCFLKTKILS